MCFGVAKDLHAIQNIWHQHAADFVAGGVCREMGDMRVATEKAETFLHHERGMCTALGDALRSAFTDCLQLHTLSAHHWQLHTASLAFVVLAQLCGLITVFSCRIRWSKWASAAAYVYTACILPITNIFMGNATASLLVDRLVITALTCLFVCIHYLCATIFMYTYSICARACMFTPQHDRPDHVCMHNADCNNESALTSHCVSLACFAGEQRTVWRGCWG